LPVDGDVIDLDTTLVQEFFDVSVRHPSCRYQRTAGRITSGGNRNPANDGDARRIDRARYDWPPIRRRNSVLAVR